jgi:hypothetical protein
MKYTPWFKGLVLITLACFTAQGSVFAFTSTQDETSTNYKVAVSTGQDQSAQASANLSISGENSKVSVTKEGTVSIVAGKSIILRPGTKVTYGGFLYASIEPVIKEGKHIKKQVKLVTVEENKQIESQKSLSFAYTLFSPFPNPRKGHLHAGDAEQGSFTSSVNDLSAVSPEQQRKVAIESRLLSGVARTQLLFSNTPAPVAIGYRPEAMRVLRL